MTTEIPDHYEALGAQPEDPAEIIRALFRARMLELHPDKQAAGDIGDEAAYQAARTAWEVLGDPAKRKKYDQQRQLAASRSRFVQVHIELVPDDMELTEDGAGLAYPCRCGDHFFLALDSLPEHPGDKILVPCASCSLYAQVHT